jgi:hypothetical protein
MAVITGSHSLTFHSLRALVGGFNLLAGTQTFLRVKLSFSQACLAPWMARFNDKFFANSFFFALCDNDAAIDCIKCWELPGDV